MRMSSLSFLILLCHVWMMLLGSSQKLLKLCSVSASSSLQALTHSWEWCSITECIDSQNIVNNGACYGSLNVSQGWMAPL